MSGFRLTPAARTDLKNIWNYTDDCWGPLQANSYLAVLSETLDTLAESPDLGRRRDEVRPGYRSFPAGRHVIFYRRFKDVIEVVRILHQSMDIARHF